ncbi:MAG: SigB/SigF/SigG family RNA polymerase sigma factor [Solirubrobacterales bacterium]
MDSVQEPAVSATGLRQSALAHADERDLMNQAAEGDTAARGQLIERYLPLARRLAARYKRAGEPLDDLFQVASMGLVKAAERFDASRGTAFSSYAVPTILGELKRHFRDRGWTIHVPRELQERVLEIDRTVDELSTEIGRSPSVREIADRLNVSTEAVLEAMEASSKHEPSSLDETRRSDDGTGAPVSESVGGDDPGYEVVEYGAAIEGTLNSLSDRDRKILHLRFVEDLTQSVIAGQVGVSQMHVSRIIRRSLDRLRDAAEPVDDAA